MRDKSAEFTPAKQIRVPKMVAETSGRTNDEVQETPASPAFLLTSRSSGKVLFTAINFAVRARGPWEEADSCKIHPELPPAVRTSRK